MKRTSISIASIIAAACVLAPFFTTAYAQTVPPAPTSNQPPDYVVYGLLFQEVSGLKQAETNAKAQSKPGPVVRNIVKHRFGFDDRTAAVYEQVALDCQTEVAAIDAQAMAIIKRIRDAYPGGVILPGEKPPLPPPELATLQQQRNAVILRYKTLLESQLGPSAFAAVVQYNQRHAASIQRRAPGPDAGFATAPRQPAPAKVVVPNQTKKEPR